PVALDLDLGLALQLLLTGGCERGDHRRAVLVRLLGVDGLARVGRDGRGRHVGARRAVDVDGGVRVRRGVGLRRLLAGGGREGERDSRNQPFRSVQKAHENILLPPWQRWSRQEIFRDCLSVKRIPQNVSEVASGRWSVVSQNSSSTGHRPPATGHCLQKSDGWFSSSSGPTVGWPSRR